MQTMIFTGNGGAGTALAAAATAAAAAEAGRRTLLVSLGPSHGLGALLGAPAGPQPATVAPGLDAWSMDAAAELTSFWAQLRGQAGGPALSAEELPLLPGADVLAGVARLSALPAGSYDLLVLEAGQHDNLLRALAVPDSVRWIVRLAFGLDRGPGRGASSTLGGMLPTGLMGFDWIGQIQEARVQLEQVRDRLSDPAETRVRYVLRPDPAALAEARLALPALQLYGLSVEALVVGPLLPASSDGLAALGAEQAAVATEAAGLWPTRSLLRLPAAPTPDSVGGLAALGAALYGEVDPTAPVAVGPPVEVAGPPSPVLAVDLPGLPTGALGLTLSGDEIIVRAGPYRRHILLPDGLRGGASIRAARSGERLVVRLRGA